MYALNKMFVNGIILVFTIFLFACNKNNPTESTKNNDTGPLTDIDGNVYQTVQIGNQRWMAENLKVTHYRNGEAIPKVTDNSAWSGLSTGAYCVYDNNESNADTYGYLYNWYALDDSRNIAPEGWHVPTDNEWKELEIYLGMNTSDADNTGWRGTNEGDKLKTTSGWGNNDNGTNESGLSLLPGGMRGGGNFNSKGDGAYFWSSGRSSSYAWSRYLGAGNSAIFRYSYLKQYAFSVRLIKN